MKKCVALFLSLMCILSLLAIPAMAAAPSSTTGGMNQAAAPEDTDTVISINADEASEEKKAAQKSEVEKLAAAESPVAYFATVKDKDGKEVSLTEMLGAEDVKVNELQPITIADYKKESGDLTVTLTFATAYAKDEAVVIMIGFVTENGVEWIALEGIGTDSTAVEQAGGISVTIPAEIAERIQNEVALVAVVSK